MQKPQIAAICLSVSLALSLSLPCAALNRRDGETADGAGMSDHAEHIRALQYEALASQDTDASDLSAAAFSGGISAECAVLADSCGRVLYARNAQRQHGIASTTKIMTAYVALERLDPDAEVTVSPLAVGIEGSSVYLRAGEVLTVRELLYAVMLQSANDAAAALAIAACGSVDAFACAMNEKAAALGMRDTHFTNPHGLPSDDHYSTAADMAILTAHALNLPAFREIVSMRRATIRRQDSTAMSALVNHNRLLFSYPGAVGVKTGFTKSSGRCLVSAAERDGVLLVAVTLNAPDDWRDHAALLDYGFSVLECEVFAQEGEVVRTLPVAGGTLSEVHAICARRLACVLPRDHGELRVEYELRPFYFAPVACGDKLGRASVYENDTLIAACDLVAQEAVPLPQKEKLPFRQRLRRWLFGAESETDGASGSA